MSKGELKKDKDMDNLLTEMHGEGAPLGGGCVEISVFHVKIPRTDSLGPQSENREVNINICAGGQHFLWNFDRLLLIHLCDV